MTDYVCAMVSVLKYYHLTSCLQISRSILLGFYFVLLI